MSDLFDLPFEDEEPPEEPETAPERRVLRLRRPDGTQLWIEVTGSARLEESGSILFEALVRDVSHRRRMDDQSRDLQEQLAVHQRDASAGKDSRAPSAT